MCKLKEHIDLHLSHRIETHVIEIESKESYKSRNDLYRIDLLLKLNVERKEEIYQVKKLVPAENCMGLNRHLFGHYSKQIYPWLIFCKSN